MSSESIATVESEFVPEPKWPERIIVCHARTLDGMGDFDLFVPRVSENAEDEAKGWCNSQGYTAYKILRAQPPVERRVEIEAIANIQQKCEQYWNAHNIGDAEIHAALEFIHREAAHIYHSLEPKP